MATHAPILVTALTWNLFHGRDRAPNPALHTWRSRLLRRTERDATHAQVNRPLLPEFSALLAGWDWEVALLQELPPRWLPELGRRCGASAATARTARNSLAGLRATLAELNPDLIASNEGGSNGVLVCSPAAIAAVERVTLTERPERRRLLLARVAIPGGRRLVVACTHLSVASTGRTAGELVRAAELAVGFAGDDPLLFGGDLNLRPAERPDAFAALRERYGLGPAAGSRSLDHLLARGLDPVEAPRALPGEAREVDGPDGLRLRLSDHDPVIGAFGMR